MEGEKEDEMTSIYQVDDCDWYAAESEEQAKALYFEMAGYAPDNDEVWLLDESEMASMQFTNDEEGYWGLTLGKHSFAVALAGALTDGMVPPFLFASTEQ